LPICGLNRLRENRGETAGPSTTLRSGRDDNSVGTINSGSSDRFLLAISIRQNCHPDRSVPGFPTSRDPTTATYAAFRKESRMKFANATKLDRKSGVAQWRDLLFLCLSDLTAPDKNPDPRICHPDRSVAQWRDLRFLFSRSPQTSRPLPGLPPQAVWSFFISV
jgi:hypothetical protein